MFLKRNLLLFLISLALIFSACNFPPYIRYSGSISKEQLRQTLAAQPYFRTKTAIIESKATLQDPTSSTEATAPPTEIITPIPQSPSPTSPPYTYFAQSGDTLPS